MTRIAVCCLLAISVSASGWSAENTASDLCGQPAPMVVLKTLDGNDFFLRDHCGQPRGPRHRKDRETVVFSFFTSWCKNCKLEIPVLQEMASELSSRGVKFFLINVGQPRDTVENYVFQNVITIPVLMDQYEVASKKYRVNELPTLVVIDKEGILQEYHTGFIPAYGDSINLKIQSLLDMGQAGNAGRASAKSDSAEANTAKTLENPAPEKTILKKNKTKK